ncbi:MAG TPA: hypothetical protein PKE04_16445 [Clostridia bacterium]|nr:hypothetical protein [Clostridia bacterium]
MRRSKQRILAALLAGMTCLFSLGTLAETTPIVLRTDAYKDLGFIVDAPVILPEGYTQGGGLPTLNAQLPGLLDRIQPEWFNESGIAGTEDQIVSERLQRVTRFADGSELSVWEGNSFGYKDAAEKFMYIHGIGVMARLRSMSYPREKGEALTSTELSSVTLEDATAQVIALMARIGLTVRPVHALDLDIERIRRLDNAYNLSMRGHPGQPDLQYDFDALAEEDECYYLVFCGEANGVPILEDWYTARDTESSIGGARTQVTVGQNGIVYLSQSGPYVPDGVAAENASLLTAEEALAVFARDNRRVQARHCEKVVEMTLVYAPVPDPETDGSFRLEPCWRIYYQLNQAGKAALEKDFIPTKCLVLATDGRILDGGKPD